MIKWRILTLSCVFFGAFVGCVPTTVPPSPTQRIPTLTLSVSLTTNTLAKETSIGPVFTKEAETPINLSLFSGINNDLFRRKEAILFSTSSGFADEINLAYLSINDPSITCLTCDLSYALTMEYGASRFEDPSWAPDGGKYIYSFVSPMKISLLTQDLTTGVELISSDLNWLSNPTWSADMHRIAYDLIGKNESKICVLEIGQTLHSGIPSACLGVKDFNQYPSWSQDGRKLIFSTGGELNAVGAEQRDLYYWDFSEMIFERLTSTPVSEIMPKWSPDGTKLGYLVIEQGNPIKNSLWVADWNGLNPVKIDGLGEVTGFDWAPDGKRIVITEISGIGNDQAIDSCDMGCLPFTYLKVINLESHQVMQLSDGRSWIDHPSWKPGLS